MFGNSLLFWYVRDFLLSVTAELCSVIQRNKNIESILVVKITYVI